MNRVAIVGAGITDCRGRWVEATYWDLFQQATRRTLEDAKCTAAEVDWSGSRVVDVTSKYRTQDVGCSAYPRTRSSCAICT